MESADGELSGLPVEAFVLEEALSQPWRLELVALHERVDLDPDSDAVAAGHAGHADRALRLKLQAIEARAAVTSA